MAIALVWTHAAASGRCSQDGCAPVALHLSIHVEPFLSDKDLLGVSRIDLESELTSAQTSVSVHCSPSSVFSPQSSVSVHRSPSSVFSHQFSVFFFIRFAQSTFLPHFQRFKLRGPNLKLNLICSISVSTFGMDSRMTYD